MDMVVKHTSVSSESTTLILAKATHMLDRFLPWTVIVLCAMCVAAVPLGAEGINDPFFSEQHAYLFVVAVSFAILGVLLGRKGGTKALVVTEQHDKMYDVVVANGETMRELVGVTKTMSATLSTRTVSHGDIERLEKRWQRDVVEVKNDHATKLSELRGELVALSGIVERHSKDCPCVVWLEARGKSG